MSIVSRASARNGGLSRPWTRTWTFTERDIAVLGFVEKVYDALDPFISKWEHYLGPISEDTAEEISRLTGGLSETFGDIGGELSAILTTALEDLVIQHPTCGSSFPSG